MWVITVHDKTHHVWYTRGSGVTCNFWGEKPGVLGNSPISSENTDYTHLICFSTRLEYVV